MTPAEREALILSLEPLVKILAKERMLNLPTYASFEDVLSAAWLGAIDAVDRFEPDRHIKPESYAKWRILGAIGDYLREIDPLSRDQRRHVKRGKAAELVILPIDQPKNLHSHHASWEINSAHESIADPRIEPDQARRDARLALRSLFRRTSLRPRNAKMLKRWMEGETLKALAAAHGIKESRASQVCSDAIRKLRAAA